MNASRKKIKNWFLIVAFWAILIVTFLFFSSLIILKANGYQLNRNTWTITKTGMIILDGTPSTSVVKVGSRTLDTSFPVRLSNITAGNYDVMVTSDGYQGWQRVIPVAEGYASVNRDIVLFLSQATDAPAPTNLDKSQLSDESKALSTNITLDDTEILYQQALITRFSQTVLGAVIYPDNLHIVFQVGGEIRVIDLDGSNNKLLFKLTSSLPTFVAFRNNGQTLLYIDGDAVKAKTIR